MSGYPSAAFTHAMFARDGFQNCVTCDSQAPSCPSCSEGYTCTMTSQSCTQCATTQCVKSPTSTTSSDSQISSGGGHDVGAIAGGVVGGIAFIAIVTFLVWWFFIRRKRKQHEQEGGKPEEKNSAFADARQARKSTQSIASTVLTRASNVIQIAYIPGVTNRSPPETPLVPPVPPLPGASPDQHFFMPGDLRDSSWSDMSHNNNHRSIAPSLLRSSVATTVYRSDAIVSPMPAQQVMRTRAAVVSIHNGNSPTPDAPAVPAITQAQLVKAGVQESQSKSSIVARTVTAKPVMVKGPATKKNTKSPAVQTIEELSESATPSAAVSRSTSKKENRDPSTSGFDASSDDEDDDAKPSMVSRISTVRDDSSAVSQSPFKDQPVAETNPRISIHLDNSEGTTSNRNSKTPPPRVESPFSDVNEVK